MLLRFKMDGSPYRCCGRRVCVGADCFVGWRLNFDMLLPCQDLNVLILYMAVF